METYITFHKIISLLQEYQEGNPMINSFGYGNLVDFGKNVSGSTVVYPFLFVVPLSITYDENTTTYQVTLIFADRLNDNLDNEVDCISDSSLNARNFLSEIRRGNLQDYFDITLPQSAQPFLDRFNDNVAGVALDANIIVYEDINACPQYPTPTPSSTPNQPTPSQTSTPTVTPTNTATPTVTPTITRTPNVTPTNTSTPSPTPSGGLPPGVLAFLVHRGGSQNSACNGNPNEIVYAADLGNCVPCEPLNCWACLTTSQQVFSDVGLTIPVVNGYYKNDMSGFGNNATWHIVGGFPQPGGFMGCS